MTKMFHGKRYRGKNWKNECWFYDAKDDTCAGGVRTRAWGIAGGTSSTTLCTKHSKEVLKGKSLIPGLTVRRIQPRKRK